MRVLEDVQSSCGMVLDTLSINRLRSFLTVLGIVIGVGTVIVMSSLINGLNHNAQTIIARLGTNKIFVFRLPLSGSLPTVAELLRRQLTPADAEALQALPHVVAASASLRFVGGGAFGGEGATTVRVGNRKSENVGLDGETESADVVNDWRLESGRIFTHVDMQRLSAVVILGSDIATDLFPRQDPVGEQISVGGISATVIGVLAPVEAIGRGKNPNDNFCYFPITTFQNMHPEMKDAWITVRYDDPLYRTVVQDEMEEVLRIRRAVTVEKENDFSVFGSDLLLRIWGDLTSGLSYLMLGIASIGLLIGGVGVMNVMLVSVTERTKEIGIRKAIGATKQSIMLQFASEAIFLCAVGGLAGVLLGMVIVLVMHFFLPCALSPGWLLSSLAVSCVIGLLAGIYPAWTAAALNPIDALRYE